MKVKLEMIWLMELENASIKMVTFIKENGEKIKETVKEF